jgi:excisionase family DNA binding protein
MKQDHPRQTQETAQEGQQDRPQDVLDRLTVAQAADRLGVTQDAVRKRIARGTIRHEKDYEGHIFVIWTPSKASPRPTKTTAKT